MTVGARRGVLVWVFALLALFLLAAPTVRAQSATGLCTVEGAPATSTTTATTKPVARYIPDIKFPGLFENEPMDSDLLSKYLRAVFIYMVWSVGVLAVVMTIYGGIKWVAAAGNASRINDAKDAIMNSIIGLIIALTSYLLLWLINPQLLVVTLPDPNASKVTQVTYTGAHITRVCTEEESNANSIDCGQTQKIGSETSTDGVATDTYCISTRCNVGTVWGVAGNTYVCNLNYNKTAGYYFAGAGCVSRVTAVSVVAGTGQCQAPRSDSASFPTMQIDPGKHRLTYDCGFVQSNYRLGMSCGVKLTQHSFCYMVGPQAKFDSAIIQKDSIATNFCCPNEVACNPNTL